MYIEFNANPKHKIGDCAVRAVCKALNKDWQTTYFDLCKLGSQLWSMPNNDEVIEKYLEMHGFIRKSYKAKKGSKRPTVADFARLNNHGTYVVRVANHVTCIVDGNIYDIWDCSSKCVYSYYELALK